EDVEVAPVVEDAEVPELELAILGAELARYLDELSVRIAALRILVRPSQIARRRGRVLVVVDLLYVFAVVALGTAHAEKTFFEDGVLLVPERERQAERLVLVADASQTIFAPTVRAAARMIVREVVPSVAVRAVILADRSPRALSEIRPPGAPAHDALLLFSQT